MDLPQELINAIVDAVVDDVDLAQDPWIIDNTDRALDTLKSCSLVARAFVHPCQTYVFHGIALTSDSHISPLIFATILSEAPHLASHVRALYFEGNAATAREHSASLSRILPALVNLVRLDISTGLDDAEWVSYPAAVRTAFASSLALPSLRHVTLWYFAFDDARKLQDLLAASIGLRTLVLRSISFRNEVEEDGEQLPSAVSASAPRVALDSLQLYFLDAQQVQELLNAFTTIAITHLRTFYLHNSPMRTLLRLNAPTIQHLKIRGYYSGSSSSPHTSPVVFPHARADIFLASTIDPDALAEAHGLETLDIRVPFLTSLTKMLRLFGTLDHLTRLATIVVSVSQKTVAEDWAELDACVGELPGLREVKVYSGSEFNPAEPHAEALLREWMPQLAGRGVLRVHAQDDTRDF
ncbi:hypothetical protein C8R46DRAFT_1343098 [Mycena filopes]|nr:hypothetical protein C8R46DRAFT_1343098 [Mycena filopes]